MRKQEEITLSWEFERAFHKYMAYENALQDFGIGMPLTQKEIHAVVIICEQEGISLGELARNRGVTKGAMSQLVTRLVKKGLVRKEVSPESASYVCLYPTSLGKKAYEGHGQSHERMGENIGEQILAELSDDEVAKFTTLFRKLSDLIDEEMQEVSP